MGNSCGLSSCRLLLDEQRGTFSAGRSAGCRLHSNFTSTSKAKGVVNLENHYSWK